MPSRPSRVASSLPNPNAYPDPFRGGWRYNPTTTSTTNIGINPSAITDNTVHPSIVLIEPTTHHQVDKACDDGRFGYSDATAVSSPIRTEDDDSSEWIAYVSNPACGPSGVGSAADYGRFWQRDRDRFQGKPSKSTNGNLVEEDLDSGALAVRMGWGKRDDGKRVAKEGIAGAADPNQLQFDLDTWMNFNEGPDQNSPLHSPALSCTFSTEAEGQADDEETFLDSILAPTSLETQGVDDDLENNFYRSPNPFKDNDDSHHEFEGHDSIGVQALSSDDALSPSASPQNLEPPPQNQLSSPILPHISHTDQSPQSSRARPTIGESGKRMIRFHLTGDVNYSTDERRDQNHDHKQDGQENVEVLTANGITHSQDQQRPADAEADSMYTDIPPSLEEVIETDVGEHDQIPHAPLLQNSPAWSNPSLEYMSTPYMSPSPSPGPRHETETKLTELERSGDVEREALPLSRPFTLTPVSSPVLASAALVHGSSNNPESRNSGALPSVDSYATDWERTRASPGSGGHPKSTDGCGDWDRRSANNDHNQQQQDDELRQLESSSLDQGGDLPAWDDDIQTRFSPVPLQPSLLGQLPQADIHPSAFTSLSSHTERDGTGQRITDDYDSLFDGSFSSVSSDWEGWDSDYQVFRYRDERFVVEEIENQRGDSSYDSLESTDKVEPPERMGAGSPMDMETDTNRGLVDEFEKQLGLGGTPLVWPAISGTPPVLQSSSPNDLDVDVENLNATLNEVGVDGEVVNHNVGSETQDRTKQRPGPRPKAVGAERRQEIFKRIIGLSFEAVVIQHDIQELIGIGTNSPSPINIEAINDADRNSKTSARIRTRIESFVKQKYVACWYNPELDSTTRLLSPSSSSSLAPAVTRLHTCYAGASTQIQNSLLKGHERAKRLCELERKFEEVLDELEGLEDFELGEESEEYGYGGGGDGREYGQECLERRSVDLNMDLDLELRSERSGLGSSSSSGPRSPRFDYMHEVDVEELEEESVGNGIGYDHTGSPGRLGLGLRSGLDLEEIKADLWRWLKEVESWVETLRALKMSKENSAAPSTPQTNANANGQISANSKTSDGEVQAWSDHDLELWAKMRDRIWELDEKLSRVVSVCQDSEDADGRVDEHSSLPKESDHQLQSVDSKDIGESGTGNGVGGYEDVEMLLPEEEPASEVQIVGYDMRKRIGEQEEMIRRLEEKNGALREGAKELSTLLARLVSTNARRKHTISILRKDVNLVIKVNNTVWKCVVKTFEEELEPKLKGLEGEFSGLVRKRKEEGMEWVRVEMDGMWEDARRWVEAVKRREG